jgi:acetoin utilization deacetylase AcuC-like enzyme
MKIVCSDDHRGHDPLYEFNRGRLVPAYESPARAAAVLNALREAELGEIEAASSFPLEPILRVHRREYVDFLEHAYEEWQALGRTGDALPLAWPVRGLRSDRAPRSLDGRLSFYSFDISTPVTVGTWRAAKGAANVALAGAQYVSAGREWSAFGLCRPPGHHAATDCYGGYCFLNNAAIAAQSLRDNGAAKVAILDVDYHHGNGTQQIFYERADVLFVSIHADPATDFPYFLGYVDETGAGEGRGFNRNLPLPAGTGWDDWSAALDAACGTIAAFAPDTLVVSLGMDTFSKDPLASFRLESDDYLRMGARIARLARPTLFLMEGGYALEELGLNVANVLRGYEDAAPGF